MPGKSVELSAKYPWARRCVALLLVILGPALLASWPAFADSPATYDDAIKQVSSQLAATIASSGKKAVAVADFTDLDGNVTELGRFLSSDLSGSLAAQANGFMVIDRAQSKGTPQASSIDAWVTGSLTTFSDHIRLSAKLLDATTSAILGAASVDIPRTKDIDALLAGSPLPPVKSASAHAAASSSAQSSSASNAANANSGSAPSSGAAPPTHKTHGIFSKTPKSPSSPASPATAKTAPAAPSLTGMGSVTTDAYRVIATSLAVSAGTATLTLEFDSVGDNTVQLAMLPAQTYLTDETGVRWALSQPDTAKIFNVRGGFWRGVPLAKNAKIQTVLTFTPQGPAASTKFTLTISEFRPKWNRVIAIQGLK